MKLRTLVVCGADELYFPWLDDLINSLRQWQDPPFTDIACFDLGLTRESRMALERRVARVVEPLWDLPADEALRARQPGLRAHTARPFLPRYFPGYDIYIWIDADAWVQKRFALDWYIGAVAQGLLGAAAHTHAAYRSAPESIKWRRDRMEAYFGQAALDRIRWDMYLNSGVVALRSDAPHWEAWARALARGLAATSGKYFSDQNALNYAVWTEYLPVSPLPAVCNWLTHLALPGFDLHRRGFCELVAPGHLIGILHLTDLATRAGQFDLQDGSGCTMSLRFPGAQRDREEPAT